MLEKLRADQDLQCYFERPSAIAALSNADANGFTVSGTWRQQFDWCVLEWNRDNVFEHPLFRPLPDGNLSQLTLTYEEERVNAIPVDSDLYPTVDWPYLRVWSMEGGFEKFHQVALRPLAVPVAGAYQPASAVLELGGVPSPGDHVGFFCLGERYNHELLPGEMLENAAIDLVAQVNNHSQYFEADLSGLSITLRYVGKAIGGGRSSLAGSETGSNGNRLGVYTYVSGSQSENWSVPWVQFTGGLSPSRWRYTIPFGSLVDRFGNSVSTQDVRKLRWTYAAELQNQAYVRSEFSALVSGWTVTGSGRQQKVAGRGGQRMEDRGKEVDYTGEWKKGTGNFSGGTISLTTTAAATAVWSYSAVAVHSLYLGTRLTFNGASVNIYVDGALVKTDNLFVAGEDVLARRYIGEFAPGAHTVRIEHVPNPGQSGLQYLYLDFFEVVLPTFEIPIVVPESQITLATDWDTDHSLPLAAERTAAMLATLGFRGRHNYYVGALWFYELYCKGVVYASKRVTFVGSPVPNTATTLTIVRDDYPPNTAITLSHLNWHGDSGATLAKAFEQEINRGYTSIRAVADGNQLSIYSRSLGIDGDHITVSGQPVSGGFRVEVEGGPNLEGGTDGVWTTDMAVVPRVNRACRDWSRSFFVALKNYGIDACAAFSTELQHGDDSLEAGVAQRYPDQSAVWLNTPALQTNFSPQSITYWRQVYLDMATLMDEGGIRPYLQFGEVQWWYFPKRDSSGTVGMPFYDLFTRTQFEAQFGRPMGVILSDFAEPSQFPDEAAFLPTLIGNYTDAIMSFVRQSYPTCRFEVLYPTDVNAGPMNQVINYPNSAWTPEKLDNLKTESFIYTLERRFEESRTKTIEFGFSKGFTHQQRSHLVGISSPPTAWMKEARVAEQITKDSVVLFALDQFCLIGYPIPIRNGRRKTSFQAV